ncbi:MAG: dTMP kinase [Oligoflexales bacterium]|nr:dTMP kinase [Oligoflexales bacterium]
MRKHSGVFVSCEGGEGVGKTLFIDILSRHIKELGHSVVLTREPGGTLLGEQIRQLFNHANGAAELAVEVELFLLSAARAQHVQEKILPALARGDWVLCDRFIDSTWVYQGALKGFPMGESFLEETLRYSTAGLEPDLTFLLDCPVDVSMERLKQRRGEGLQISMATRYDEASKGFHEKLRLAYLSLMQKAPLRMKLIDVGSKAPDEILTEAVQHLQPLFERTQQEKSVPREPS